MKQDVASAPHEEQAHLRPRVRGLVDHQWALHGPGGLLRYIYSKAVWIFYDAMNKNGMHIDEKVAVEIFEEDTAYFGRTRKTRPVVDEAKPAVA